MKYLFNFSIVIFIFFISLTTIQAQKFDWIELSGGPSYEYVYDIALDDQYIYMAGYYSNSMVFGSTTISSQGNTDIFLAKYDTLGNFYWAKSFGGKAYNGNNLSSIGVDVDGNLLLGGMYIDTITFGNISLYSISKRRYSNFILKLDPNGSPLWAKSIDYGSSVSIYSQKGSLTTIGTDIYFSGGVRDSLLYDGNYISGNGLRNYLFKINANGTLIWDQYIEYSNMYAFYAYQNHIASDQAGYVYLASLYMDTIQTASFKVHSTGYGSTTDIYVVKFDTSGTAQWLKTTADTNYSYLNDFTVDRSGDIYLSGPLYPSSLNQYKITWGSLTLTGEGLYLLKLNTNGALKWGEVYGKTIINYNYSGLSIGNEKNIFITGSFSGSFALGGTDSLRSRGYNDALMLKVDSMGGLLWGQQVGGGGNEHGTAVVADQLGNAYFAGYFSGLSLFGTRTLNTVNGSSDLFLLKLSECTGFQADIQALGDTISCDANLGVRLKTTNDVGYAFQWMKNQLSLPGENFPNLFPMDSGAYSVIVNDNGCIDTSRVIQITFDTLPHVSFQAAFDSICAADAPVQLSGGTPLGGSWSGAGVNNGFFDPSLADTGYVKITYTFSNGLCADSVSQLIYVSPAPQPKIGGLHQVCENTAGISYSTNSPGPVYNWNISGGSLVSGQGSNSIIVNWGSSGNGIIQLTETNAGGCQKVLSDTIDIVDPLISANISGQDTVCINSGFYKYSVNAASFFYNWTVSGGNIQSGQGTSSIKVNWNVSGNGKLSVRLFNSCGTDSTFFDTVYVSPKPNPSISGLNQVCENSSGNTYSSNGSGPQYVWKLSSGSIISGQGTASIDVDWGSSGNAKVSLIETNSNHCSDSASINVNIKELKDTSYAASICYGTTFNFGGTSLNASGTYQDTLTASNGCDSIIVLNLTVMSQIASSITADICAGDSYFFDGQSLTNAGTYYDTLSAVNGCDSTITLNLTILPIAGSSINQAICSGSSYQFGGKSLSIAGNYKDTLRAANGCDSIVSLSLSLLPHSSSTVNASICSNDSYYFNGQNLSTQGTYTDTLMAANGCDSVISLNLSILNSPLSSITENICFGQSFLFDGQFLSQSGTYYDTLTASNACDSIVKLVLSVSPKITSTQNISICSGETYFFDNQNLSAAGIYYDTLMSVNTCDSIVTLDLQVLQNSSASINASICSGESYSLGGNKLTMTGTYRDTLLSANGCDSIVLLNLTVLPTASSTINASICSNQSYAFAGQNLTIAGKYTDTLSAANSCDSVVSLNLTVLNSFSDTLDASICPGDSYQFNGRSLSLAGFYMDTLQNQNGCDSILTLDLTIDQVNVSVMAVSDSLIAQATGASYQWLKCNASGSYTAIPGATSAIYKVTTNGNYAVEVSQNNCTDTSKCIKVLITGLDENSTEFSLKVFPNPSGGMLFIEGEIQASKEVQIRILNMLGEELILEDKAVNDGKLKSAYNIDSYSNGIYFVEIQLGERKVIKKIVLQ